MVDGNAEQVRVIADQMAEVVFARIAREPPPKAEIPPPLKWAGGIVAALLVAGAGGTATWLVTTVNEMQLTLARMDERMSGETSSTDRKWDDVERRIGRLERYHEQRVTR